MMTFGSLFAGIGGIDLGLERASMRCAWQVEWNDYANKVLTRHWPDVARFRDVRDCGSANLAQVDLIAGGFPCQDISYAGAGAGLAGERSGLWFEFARIIRELAPRYVLVENVSALLDRGMGDVLGSLASLGYDAEWECIPAFAVGAPHRRDRVFIIAYAHSIGSHRILCNKPENQRPAWRNDTRRIAREVAASVPRGDVDGIPYRVERLRGLGNAVVPQVAEFIGRLILEHEVNHG